MYICSIAAARPTCYFVNPFVFIVFNGGAGCLMRLGLGTGPLISCWVGARCACIVGVCHCMWVCSPSGNFLFLLVHLVSIICPNDAQFSRPRTWTAAQGVGPHSTSPWQLVTSGLVLTWACPRPGPCHCMCTEGGLLVHGTIKRRCMHCHNVDLS